MSIYIVDTNLKEGDKMNGKVLIFIRDYQIKRNIISILTHLQVHYGVFEEEELSLNCNYIQKEIACLYMSLQAMLQMKNIHA